MEVFTAKGRHLGPFGLRPNGSRGLVAVHRADLLSILASHLDQVRLDARATDVIDRGAEVGVVLNGGEAVGDVLVGADGIRSIVRQHVAAGDQPRYSGITAWRGVSGAPPSTAHAMAYGVGRGWEGGAASIGRRGVYWFLETRAPLADRVAADEGRRVLELVGDMHPEIVRHVEATPGDCVIRTDLFDLPRIRRWTRGGVTLLGDAAHAMLPNLGQGATQALLDARALARCLDADAPDLGLARYERRRRPQTAALQLGSRLAGRAVTVGRP